MDVVFSVFRTTLITLALLMWFSAPESSFPVSQALSFQSPATDFIHYLPFIPVPAQVDAVVTAQGEDIGYPTRYHTYGYLSNLSGETLYDVWVHLVVYIQGYLEPEFFPMLVRITPAFTATLPGQPNPFSYSLLLGKAIAQFGPILETGGHFWSEGLVFYPLTIASFSYSGTLLSGMARNDSDLQLTDLRVVVFEPLKCGWIEMEVDLPSLPPGGEAPFQGQFPAQCWSDQLVVVGQGGAPP